MMKKGFKAIIWIVLLLSIGLLSGCGSALVTSTNRGDHMSANIPSLNMSRYKSVQTRKAQDPKLGVGMAISGGGTRAANFAMGVMLGLEEIRSDDGNGLKEVDYFSTVSGGGFAGGAYISSLYDHHFRLTHDPGFRDAGPIYSLVESYTRRIEKDLSRSYVDPMLKSYFFSMKAWFSHVDEGDALEKAVDTHVLGHKWRNQLNRKKNTSIQLGDMFIGKEEEKPVVLPIMVANGTVYSNMAIFPFTPDILETYEICGYTHRTQKVDHKKTMDPLKMPLSVGIKASGSFPVLISNTTLISSQDPEYRYLHLIDGGVADNIGYKTAIELLKQDRVAKKKFLFVVDADCGGHVPTFSRKQGGAFSLGVYSKMATSGLDSKHIMLHKDLNSLCKLNDITPVYFNFACLIEEHEELPALKFKKKKETKRILEILENNPESLTLEDWPILYELARNVKTKYTITKVEQNLMIQIGKMTVKLRKDELQKIFNQR